MLFGERLRKKTNYIIIVTTGFNVLKYIVFKLSSRLYETHSHLKGDLATIWELILQNQSKPSDFIVHLWFMSFPLVLYCYLFLLSIFMLIL